MKMIEIDFEDITEITVLVPFKITLNKKECIIYKEIHITREDML